MSDARVAEIHAQIEALRAEADRLESENCSGLAACWCPIHGDCACPERENALDDPNCPLHAPESSHAAKDEQDILESAAGGSVRSVARTGGTSTSTVQTWTKGKQ